MKGRNSNDNDVDFFKEHFETQNRTETGPKKDQDFASKSQKNASLNHWASILSSTGYFCEVRPIEQRTTKKVQFWSILGRGCLSSKNSVLAMKKQVVAGAQSKIIVEIQLSPYFVPFVCPYTIISIIQLKTFVTL